MTAPRSLRSTLAPSRPGSTMVVVVVVAILATAAVATLTYFISRQATGEDASQLTAVVKRFDFVHDVVESGEVESSENVEVRCEVKSRNSTGITILDVAPEGAIVRGPSKNEQGEMVEGTLLVSLDSSGLELEKQQEGIILNNKVASRDQAFNGLIAAISALKEYTGSEEFVAKFIDELTERLGGDAEEVLAAIQTGGENETANGMFHVEEQGFQAELFLAEEDLRKAEQYFRYSESLAAQGYVTDRQLKSDKFAVEKARKDRDAARTKLDVLRIHTRKKTEKMLTGDIYNALAVYRAEKSSVQLQEERVQELQEQIEKCLIYAPQDGQVVYANQRDHRGNTDFLVEPGASVRERQVIIRLPNSTKMQVEAKISESKISLVREDKQNPMKATVTIDAFDDVTLDGIVTRVNQYPEPTSWFSSTVKVYEAEIQIIDPPVELKSGLTAKVRIHAQRIPDALQVPIQAAHRHHGKFYCFVKDGPNWQATPVTLGASNEKHVVIEDGLREGDQVAMDPGSLLEDVDLPDAPQTSDEQLASDAQSLASKYVAVDEKTNPPTVGHGQPRPSPSDASTPGRAGMPSAATIVASIFSSSDTNKDGKLTRDELPERFQTNFSQTDTNGDGGIDRGEMTAAIAKRMQQRPGAGGQRQ